MYRELGRVVFGQKARDFSALHPWCERSVVSTEVSVGNRILCLVYPKTLRHPKGAARDGIMVDGILIWMSGERREISKIRKS